MFALFFRAQLRVFEFDLISIPWQALNWKLLLEKRCPNNLSYTIVLVAWKMGREQQKKREGRVTYHGSSQSSLGRYLKPLRNNTSTVNEWQIPSQESLWAFLLPVQWSWVSVCCSYVQSVEVVRRHQLPQSVIFSWVLYFGFATRK